MKTKFQLLKSLIKRIDEDSLFTILEEAHEEFPQFQEVDVFFLLHQLPSSEQMITSIMEMNPNIKPEEVEKFVDFLNESLEEIF